MSDPNSAGGLAEEPFSYRTTKDGKVFIYWRGKQVITLKGSRAGKLLADLADADAAEAQLQLARITGNFKRGNERRTKPDSLNEEQ